MPYGEERLIALEAVSDAAALVRSFWDADFEKEGMAEKGPGDYVTACDTHTEERILRFLSARTPDIPVLGEEGGGKRHERMWVVDPIDGTTNFVRRYPIVGISVGLVVGGIPVAGAVAAPFLHAEWSAATGEGAFAGTEGIHVRESGRMVVATGFPFRRRDRLPEYLPVMLDIFQETEDIRRAGSASLDLCFTAQGSTDGYFELSLGLWDIAAGSIILREAGGIVTDWEGDAAAVYESGDVLAGSPACHDLLLNVAARHAGLTGPRD